MLKEFDRNSSKMDIAKNILSDLVDSLKNHSKLEIALRVYGHHYKPSVTGCEDTHLEVPFSKNNHGAIVEKLESIVPRGGTPLAYSLEQTVNDFPTNDPSYNVVILITDGAESCKGDPCSVSKKLQQAGIFLKPYIIGLDMDGRYENMFNCLGTYFNAKDVKTFKQVLVESIQKTLYRPTVSIELLDSKGVPYKSDLTITLYNKTTNKPQYQLIHYFNNGTSDTLSLIQEFKYDVLVSSVPPVYKSGFSFDEKGHTTLKIPVPQGDLTLSMESSEYYKIPVTAIIKSNKTNRFIASQAPNSSKRYLQGLYDIEVLTRPKTIISNIDIQGEKSVAITIDEPGIVQVNHSIPGFSTIFRVNGEKLEWVENITLDKRTDTIVLQPGKYQISFRAKNAKGSKFTVTNEFEINSRQITNITIFK